MLPNKNENFQKFYAPAIKTNQPWRLIVSVIVILVVYFGFFAGFSSVVVWIAGMDAGPALLANVIKGADPQSVILLLITFVGLFLGILLALRLLHKRNLMTLLGPNMSEVVRNFKITFAIIFIVTLTSLLIFSYQSPPNKHLEPTVWLSWMLIAAPLILIQVSSEELIFRGYFMQQLAARYNSRWIWYVLPSLLFGLMHYDPGTMGSNAWIVVAHTTLFGLIASDITARTGNLGAAIGFHFANNIFALTIVTLDGSLSGLGLYKTTFHVSDEAAIRSVLVPDLIFLVVFYGIFMLWARNRPQW